MIRIDGSGCLMPKPESANIAHAILLYIEPVQMVFENMDTLDSELAVQHGGPCHLIAAFKFKFFPPNVIKLVSYVICISVFYLQI